PAFHRTGTETPAHRPRCARTPPQWHPSDRTTRCPKARFVLRARRRAHHSRAPIALACLLWSLLAFHIRTACRAVGRERGGRVPATSAMIVEHGNLGRRLVCILGRPVHQRA